MLFASDCNNIMGEKLFQRYAYDVVEYDWFWVPDIEAVNSAEDQLPHPPLKAMQFKVPIVGLLKKSPFASVKPCAVHWSTKSGSK